MFDGKRLQQFLLQINYIVRDLKYNILPFIRSTLLQNIPGNGKRNATAGKLLRKLDERITLIHFYRLRLPNTFARQI